MDIAKLNGGFGIAFFIPCFEDLEYVYTHKPADKVVNLLNVEWYMPLYMVSDVETEIIALHFDDNYDHCMYAYASDLRLSEELSPLVDFFFKQEGD